MSLRLLPVFVWMEWRQALNNLRGGRRRDGLERLSRWARVLIPLAFFSMLIPLACTLAIAAAAGAWVVSSNPDFIAVGRILTGFGVLTLLFVTLLVVVTTGRSTPGQNQLLRLLPISRSWLSLSEVIRPLAGPMVFLGAGALGGVPVGLLIAGRPLPALAAAAGGLLVLACTAALGAVVSLALQLLLRRRRRAEFAALIGVLLMSLFALVPAMVGPKREETGPTTAGPAAQLQEKPPALASLPELTPWALALPPVAYAASWTAALEGRWRFAAGGLLALFGWAGVCLWAVTVLHRRLADTPELNARQRSGTVRGLLTIVLPDSLAAVAAVAALTSRLIVRTVRGRITLFSPSLMAVVVSVVFTGARGTSFTSLPHLAMAVFVFFVAVSGFSTLTCNQLAIFGRGLTGLAVRPIPEVDMVRGTALAFATLLAASMVPAATFLTWRLDGIAPGLALALWLAAIATHLLVSPVAAVMSAIFPKAVDLTSATRGGQAHGLAQIVHLLAFVPAGAASGGVLLAAHSWVRLPAAVPIVAALWLLLAGLVAHLVLPAAARVVRTRRENLLLVAIGR